MKNIEELTNKAIAAVTELGIAIQKQTQNKEYHDFIQELVDDINYNIDILQYHAD